MFHPLFYTHLHSHACSHTHTHTHTHVKEHILKYTCTCACACACTRKYNLHSHTYAYITCTHTHTHTQVTAVEEIISKVSDAMVLVTSEIHRYTGYKRTGFVYQAASSLQWAIYYMVKQHLETVRYKCVPPWIQGLVRQDLSTLLWHVTQHTCIVYRMECSCWPSLFHGSPSSLDPVCSTLCSNCYNCLLARHVILHDFFMTRAMHGTWFLGLGLIYSLIHWTSRNAFPTLGWCDMVSRNRAPRVCREPSSSEPLVLGRACFGSCTGQIHNTACSTAHVRWYPL